jgi:SET domain-containing protein
MPRKSYTPGDFDLVIRRSPTGLGLFSESEIPKGACVIEYKGPQLTKAEEEKSNSRYLFEVHARKTIDGTPRWNTARYINHSCRPNCEPNIYKGRVYIHARRRIRPGEELNYDYGRNYFKEFLKDICACPKCKPARHRGTVRAVAARAQSPKVAKAPKSAKTRKKAKRA